MPTIPTVEEMQTRAITEVNSRNPRLTDTTEGSFIDAVTGAGALLADESIRLGLVGQARFYFDTATGTDLDTLAADRGFPPRKAATGGLGEFTWTKGDPLSSYTIPSGHRVQGTLDDGTPVVVEATSAIVVLATDVSVVVPAQAQSTGPSTNLAVGFLDTPVDIIAGDPSATVINAARFVGGSEAETDEAYRVRLRLVFSTLRRGTVAALEFGALLVAGVATASVDESLVPTDGIVRVYIGDPDARSNAALAALVVTELENWRAAGIQVIVLGADRQELLVTLTLTARKGASVATLAQDVRANVLRYTDLLAPGETFRTSEVLFAAHDASAQILSAVVVAPAADVTPTIAQDAIRVNESDISISWVEI